MTKASDRTMTDKTTTHIRIEHGECMDIMARMKEEGVKVDAVITDPPYHLTSIVKRFAKESSAQVKDKDGLYKRISRGFAGKQWDGGDVAFRPETWRAVFDIMKPGAHICAFGAPRNFGYMQVALDQAGFEIRDVVMWAFATGMPKSHDIARLIDLSKGHKMDEDSERVRYESSEANEWIGWGTALKPAYEPIILARKPLEGCLADNFTKHGVGGLNINACRISGDNPSARHRNSISEKIQAGTTPHRDSNNSVYGNKKISKKYQSMTKTGEELGRFPANVIHDGSDEVLLDIREFSKFIYCAKAGKNDRITSNHPTVKPVKIIQHLARLITPPGGIILDCFAGSGTLAAAAIREGFKAILIEREDEYVTDIRSRVLIEEQAKREDAKLI